ncbi:MAG TPA: RNA chaperone Hfq [Nitrospirota bacterium]|nr:RNA chaperone Hfq [Nitrospirota bacterium]
MEANLLDRMLSSYQEAQIPVTVTLQNNIRVSGRIRAFDSYVIMMEGQKREILYRHAVASLSPSIQEEQRRPAPSHRPAQDKTTPQSVKAFPKPRTAHPPATMHTSSGEQSINSSMKDGLLKWIQEQKAAK